MDQSATRCRYERPGDLRGQFERGVRVERTVAAHASFEGFALDQFHRVVALPGPIDGTEVEDSGDVGVSQRRRRPCLAQKAFAQRLALPGVPGGGRTKLDDLQRHRAVQHTIHGTVGHPHRSAAEFPRRAILAVRDLEVAEPQGGRTVGLWRGRGCGPGGRQGFLRQTTAQQTGQAAALCIERRTARRAHRVQLGRVLHSRQAPVSRSSGPAAVRAVPRRLPPRYPPCGATRRAAVRGTARAGG